MSVLRSVITLSFHTKAVEPVPSIENPTTSSRLLIVWQQPAMVAKAPGNVPRSCIPVDFVQKNE